MEIHVMNFSQDDIVTYSLVLIRGKIIKGKSKIYGSTDGEIHQNKMHLWHQNTSCSCYWSVVNYQFKCLVDLENGKNTIKLQYCNVTKSIRLHYKPLNFCCFVRPVYLVCSGDDGHFQAPDGEDSSSQSACEKIILGCKLIQSFMADQFLQHKFLPKTFQLECDSMGKAVCHIFHSRLTRQKTYSMSAEELWEYIGRELMSSDLGDVNCKYLAFLSCTEYVRSDCQEPWTYEEVLYQTRGHVSLGGGGLALMGTGCLHTWARKVKDVPAQLQNTEVVNRKLFMDDSGYRGTYGGCYATTLGSVCHELGHTFGLGHTRSGIMGRGFDDLDQIFTLSLPSKESLRGRKKIQQLRTNSDVSFNNELSMSFSVAVKEKDRPRIIKPPSLKSCFSATFSRKKTEEEKMRSDVNEDNIHKPVGTSFASQRSCQKGDKRQSAETSVGHTCDVEVGKEARAFWERSSQILLYYHRWFNDYPTELETASPSITFQGNIVSSLSGVRVVELRDKSGCVIYHWEFLGIDGNRKFHIQKTHLPQMVQREAVMLVAEDSKGNFLKCNFNVKD